MADPKMDTQEYLVKQILSQGTSSNWSGQGFGSAEANAKDMAKILSDIGITDIRQFGQFDIPTDEEVTPVYSYTSQDYGGETGVVTTRGGIIGYKDSKGNNVDSNLVKTKSIFKDYGDGSGYFDVPVAPVGTKNVFGNKETGQAVPVTYGERQTGNSFGGTFAGEGNTGYRVQFAPDGTPVFYTTGASSNDLANLLGDNKLLNLAATAAATYFGGPLGAGALQLAQGKDLGDAAKATLLAYAGGEISNALSGGAAAGLGAQTDASFLAADAAQLAGQGLSESAINQVLTSSGYASGAAASLASSMAVNGLDAATMTAQLDALRSNTGLMSQTGSAADFAAADALQLQEQVGNNFPAIEQNLIASGVDPLIAADISNQIALTPDLTQADVATNLSNSFGNNIYDVDMTSTYPTSVLPGEGGLLSDVPGYENTGVAADAMAFPDLPWEDIFKAISTTGAASSLANPAPVAPPPPAYQPDSTMPSYSPEYFQQIQNYYTGYMPQMPRDVATPLQDWYSQGYTGPDEATAAQFKLKG